ncbi:MAG: IF-2-associated domain-containing protein, partial [Caulobacteraceae bacterium]|nr:IF-2-associated domain-containing protein [Caulobacter sp.]
MNEPKTPSKTLSLKRPVEAGVVKQSFSHGRTKTVVVETKRSRQIAPAKPPARESAAPAVAKPPVAKAPAAPAKAPAAPAKTPAAPPPSAA